MAELLYPLGGKKVWVAGHRGMVGSALVRRLAAADCEIVTVDRSTVDLRRQEAAEAWLAETRPEAVFVAAATVGGISANASLPVDFLYDNLMIEANIVHAARSVGVEKLMFLGSSCIYPRLAEQPIHEEALLTGPLEPTNEWYAVAKIAGLKLCQAYRQQYNSDFISVMPTNLYGPGDNFDLGTSHVLAALLAKAHQAKVEGAPSIEVWGSGTPKREFLYVDDLADGLVFLMERYSAAEPINIGTGEEISIAELAALVGETVGFAGGIHYDSEKPDGMPRKLLDCSRLHSMGWRSRTALADGLRHTYAWFLEHLTSDAGRHDQGIDGRPSNLTSPRYRPPKASIS